MDIKKITLDHDSIPGEHEYKSLEKIIEKIASLCISSHSGSVFIYGVEGIEHSFVFSQISEDVLTQAIRSYGGIGENKPVI